MNEAVAIQPRNKKRAPKRRCRITLNANDLIRNEDEIGRYDYLVARID